MFNKFTKGIGLALLLLFIGGTYLAPAFHDALCSHDFTAGDTTHCPICQVTTTPCITPLSLITVNIDKLIVGALQPETRIFIDAPLCSFDQARAPPAV